MIFGVLLLGCGFAQRAAQQQRIAEVSAQNQAIRSACKEHFQDAAREAQPGRYSAFVKCEEPIEANDRAVGFPYMDIVEAKSAEDAVAAEQADHGSISDAQFWARLAETKTGAVTEIERPSLDVQRVRAEQLRALAGAVRASAPSTNIFPQPTNIFCNSMTLGSMTTSTCH